VRGSRSAVVWVCGCVGRRTNGVFANAVKIHETTILLMVNLFDMEFVAMSSRCIPLGSFALFWCWFVPPGFIDSLASGSASFAHTSMMSAHRIMMELNQ
jgi:hypothetical protein